MGPVSIDVVEELVDWRWRKARQVGPRILPVRWLLDSLRLRLLVRREWGNEVVSHNLGEGLRRGRGLVSRSGSFIFLLADVGSRGRRRR
jgi:hypothetical protein